MSRHSEYYYLGAGREEFCQLNIAELGLKRKGNISYSEISLAYLLSAQPQKIHRAAGTQIKTIFQRTAQRGNKFAVSGKVEKNWLVSGFEF